MGVPREKLGQILSHANTGRLDRAVAACQQLIRQNPGDAGVHHVMADLFMRSLDPGKALFFIARAAELAPNDPVIASAHARILGTNQKHDEVIAQARRLATLAPGTGEGELLEALALTHQQRHAAAVEACQRGLVHAPGNPQLLVTLGTALLQCGESGDAVRIFDDLVSRYPDDTLIRGNHALALNYVRGVGRDRVLEAHKAYQAMLDRTLGPSPLGPPATPADPEKRLRIGVLSPDLREHPVGRFIDPVFEHMDKSRFELAVYFTSAIEAKGTTAFKRRADLWRPCGVGSYLSIAQTIRNDRVDILIELSGHTGGEKLGVLHLRPAPIQVTYLGYPNTTGVRAIDHRIADSYTDPAGAADAWCTERLVRLDPCFLCYTPPVDAPLVEPRPAGAGITFGSFNAIQKVGDDLLAMWGRLLSACPDSRLLVKAFNLKEATLRERVLARCTAAGIDVSRLEILPPTDTPEEHLKAYHRVDIALDTHPYCGTTTTCEALWMGVPVVTLVGESHASRVGLSLLHAVGLGEFAAQSDEDYVTIAAGLTKDPARLTQLRASLRGTMAASVLCDAPGFVRRFEGALRTMWRTACG